MELREKIEGKTAGVAVVGLENKGLLTAVELANAGYKVIGVDVNEENITQLIRGKSYVTYISHETISSLVTDGKLFPTRDYSAIAGVDAVIISSNVDRAINEMLPFVQEDLLIIIEKLTYPGTIEYTIKPILEAEGYEIGRDIYLCASAALETKDSDTPRVVGGLTSECTQLGSILYKAITPRVPLLGSIKAVEFLKLLEYSSEIVNTALANELAVLCEEMGLDIWEILEASASKLYPGLSMEDTWENTCEMNILATAGEINKKMPRRVVQLVNDALNLHYKPIRGSKILCLGITRRPNTNDSINPYVLTMMRLLRAKGADVYYNDPYIPTISDMDSEYKSVPVTPETLETFDCVLLCIDHTSYDYNLIGRFAPLIVDTKNAFRGMEKDNIVRLGVGDK